jgi:hypothetical protein
MKARILKEIRASGFVDQYTKGIEQRMSRASEHAAPL